AADPRLLSSGSPEPDIGARFCRRPGGGLLPRQLPPGELLPVCGGRPGGVGLSHGPVVIPERLGYWGARLFPGHRRHVRPGGADRQRVEDQRERTRRLVVTERQLRNARLWFVIRTRGPGSRGSIRE